MCTPAGPHDRTNRPDATRTGPGADAREVLAEQGFDVLGTRIARLDPYSQSFGGPVHVRRTAYMDLASKLARRQENA